MNKPELKRRHVREIFLDRTTPKSHLAARYGIDPRSVTKIQDRLMRRSVTDPMTVPTKRGGQFRAFAYDVAKHVDEYTVPQYGDMPGDMVEEWTPTHVVHQMEKYLKRMRCNGRGNEDNILSCKKIAHYACILDGKLKEIHEC